MYDLDEMKQRIKEAKKNSKLSNDELAERSGIPKGTLSKFLGSETKDPQISTIIKIAKALGVSADFIVFGKQSINNMDIIEQDIFKYLRDFSTEGKNKVLDYVIDLYNTGAYKKQTTESELA